MAGSLFSGLSGLFSFGSSGTYVGMSIGSSSIKVAEIKKLRKGWKLLHFGIIQLQEDAIVNREIVNHISVVEGIKTLITQLKLKNKNIAASLSSTAIIIKRMSLNVPNLRELQDQVFWEAEQYLPFDISEVVMDYQLMSRSKDNQADVIFVAIKNSVLDSYMNCIEDSGLKAKVVDVDFFALQNAFEANYPTNPSEAVAIVDIGASSLKLVIVHAGIPVFTKDSSIGGRSLTAEIQKHLNLNFVDAESLKVGSGGAGTPQEVSDLTNIMSENFASEIKRGLDFYEASSSGAPVSYVLLTGGCARTPDLTRIVEEQVGLPTQLFNPFQAVEFDSSVFTEDYIAAINPIAAVPIGLAIRMGSTK